MTTLRNLALAAAGEAQDMVERIETELWLAGKLCELHPEQAEEWRPRIAAARERVACVLGRGKLDGVAEAVAEAEEILLPLSPIAKSYVVHCVGHGHIDMNWRWNWPETVSITIDTLRTVLRLMEEYPAFTYSQSQASIYTIVEEHDPDMLKQIAQRVREGRWEVTASHWVENDKNLVSGESLCRHLLYTRRYMQELFGLSPEDVPIDWSPDTFGHAATVPTYLSRGGIKYVYMHRPGMMAGPRPWMFWWKGLDGSRVLVRNDSRVGYNGVISPRIIRPMMDFVGGTKLKEFMFVYGVGDHGGGPTRRDLEMAMAMEKWPIFPTIRFSTARAFFDAAARGGDQLPVVEEELNFEFAGCYTTQSLIKRDNRYAESRLFDAEMAASFAWAAVRQTYPTEKFTECWRDTLFSQFHDILPGSGVPATRTYSDGLYQKTIASTAQIETQALRLLASRIDTSMPEDAGDVAGPHRDRRLGAGVGFRSADGGVAHSDQTGGHGPSPFVVFNSLAGERREVIEATLWDGGGEAPMQGRSFSVILPDGQLTPAQVVAGGRFWGHDRAVVAFPVQVSGMGYAQDTLIETPAEGAGEEPAAKAWQIGLMHSCSYSIVERGSEGLENDLLRVEIDPVTGGIRRLVEKHSGLELMTPNHLAAPLEYEVERPHPMSAWLIQHPGAAPQRPVLRDLRRTLKGPYKSAIDVDFQIGESKFTLTYELRAGEPRLYVHIQGTRVERGSKEAGVPSLRFCLPLALEEARGRYEIPFGAIDRAMNSGEEVPALRWAQVTGRIGQQPAGCLLLNDCKHGHSLDGSTLRLTLIRSSYEPDPLPEIAQHEIHLAIQPFTGEMPVEAAIAAGAAMNHPLRVVGTDVHQGHLPRTGQFLRITPAVAMLSAMKCSEDGEALIVRLFNPTEHPVTALVEPGAQMGAGWRSAIEVDLMEREQAGSMVQLAGGAAKVPLPPRGIVSLKLGLAEPSASEVSSR